MARRSKQLAAEVAESLARGTPHPEATPADWKKRIGEIQKRARVTSDAGERATLQHQLEAANAGLRAAQKVAASKPTYVTGTNLFALTEMVLDKGPEFPARVPPVDAPHLRRTLDAGLLEIVGNKARLTDAGRIAVADELVKRIERESKWAPRENPFVPAERRAELMAKDVAEHEAKVARLESTLAKLS